MTSDADMVWDGYSMAPFCFRYGSEEELELQEYQYMQEAGLEEIKLQLSDNFTEPIEV